MTTRSNIPQHAFNAGEFSPLMYGRQDLPKYSAGLAACVNAVPLSQGAWTRRGGSVFFTTSRFGNVSPSRLVPFRFSETQAYVFEFSDFRIRFFTDGGVVTEAQKSITDVTIANPAVITVTSHGYSNGDRVLISDSGGINILDNREVRVSAATTNTFVPQDIYANNISSVGETFTGPGSAAKIYELGTSYTTAMLPALNFETSGDVLYIFSPVSAPQMLTRVAPASWALTPLTFKNGPYLPLNVSLTTLTLSSTGSTPNITASAVTGINDGQGFLTTDVGRLIRWWDASASRWAWYTITSRTSSTVVVGLLGSIAPSVTTATTEWHLGLYSGTTGYPTYGVVHEDRLWISGSLVAAQRIDGSFSQIYDRFSPSNTDGTVTPAHAISVSLGSGPINEIVWLQSNDRGLLIGTPGDIWLLSSSTSTEPLAPGNVAARVIIPWGAKDTPPVRAAYGVLYVQRGGMKLRETAFVFEQDGFRAPDLTILAEHITYPGIERISAQQLPQDIIWGRLSNGALVGMTYERDQDVVAWHRHVLGGVSNAGGDSPVIESIATIPSISGVYDETYVIVRRYINGREERYIEFFAPIWQTGDTQETAFHVDSGVSYAFITPQATLGGLWHLEGQTVTILADGVQHATRVVTAGKVTLSGSVNVATVGLAYSSEGLTLPPDAPTREGSGQGLKKRIHRLAIWMRDTMALDFGLDSDTVTALPLDGVTPFTGVMRERFDGRHDLLAQVYFRANGATPATVLSLTNQILTEEDT